MTQTGSKKSNGSGPAVPQEGKKQEKKDRVERQGPPPSAAAATSSAAAAACTRWHSVASADRIIGFCCMNSYREGTGTEHRSGKRARVCSYGGHTKQNMQARPLHPAGEQDWLYTSGLWPGPIFQNSLHISTSIYVYIQKNILHSGLPGASGYERWQTHTERSVGIPGAKFG